MSIKQKSLTKKVLYLLAIFSFLTTITNCGCVNPTSPKPTIDPDMKSNENIFVFPENSITIKKFVDLNIMDTLRPGSNYTPNDVSIAFSPGVDMLIADTNNLNIDVANGTISGSLKLKQRLDCENPIDDNVDNDYVIATFNMVDNGNTINDELKLIVRITDVEVEVTKVEILIDKFHLPAGNVLRGIKELYLYEDSNVSNSISGDDPDNFLSADLIASATVIGEVYPGSDIKKLYDKDDVNDGFLIDTANTNMSNIYHRLTFNFKEKVNLKKVAIRSQGADYGGFYFIIRDENDHILYVQRANASAARRSGADLAATSTYSFVPSYRLSRYPITDFDIKTYNNNNFTLYENSTNVFLIDNFYVKQGYEYERGFVKFSRLGADIEKFNTNNVFFIYNELMGLTFKEAPDFEMPGDADSNNTYEVGTVTITNVDGGRVNFPLEVRTLNVPSRVLLFSNQISYTIDVYTSNVIENLLEYVDFVGLDIDPDSVGDIAYNYELTGEDAIHFKIVRNKLQTRSPFGFISNGSANPEYNFELHYIPDHGIRQTLNVTIEVIPLNTNYANLWWVKVHTSNIIENLLGHYDTNILGVDPSFAGMDYELTGADAGYFKTEGDALKTVAEYGFSNILNNNARYNLQVHYIPKDGSIRHQVVNVAIGVVQSPVWHQITSSAPWPHRANFQVEILSNNDLLLIGGKGNVAVAGLEGHVLQDLWLSSNEGTSWSNITPPIPWNLKIGCKAVVLNNNDILVMNVNGIWQSRNSGRDWNRIASTPGGGILNFEAVVLNNNDILIMGGNVINGGPRDDIWLSEDGGSNWSEIISSSPMPAKTDFQAEVLTNNDILVMGGAGHKGIWLSKDSGTNWSNIVSSPPWAGRFGQAQLVVLNNNDILVIGEAHINVHTYKRIWQSRDGGFTWHNMAPPSYRQWNFRYQFEAVVLKNNDVLIMGGYFGSWEFNDISRLSMNHYNKYYYRD